MKVALLCVVAFLVCGSVANWPSTWSPVRKAESSERLSFTLALKQRNLAAFNRLFERITTPGSPEYGQYRTIKELSNMIAPPVRIQNRILGHLTEMGCDATSYGDSITAECSVSAVEELFSVEIHEFRHELYSDYPILRSIVYPTIPAVVQKHVEFVTGISTFPFEKRQIHKTKLVDDRIATDKWVIPQTLRNLYNIPSSVNGNVNGNSMGVVEFGIVAGISQDDLNEFNKQTNTTDSQLAYTVGTFAFTPISPIDGESTLDVQYILGVGTGVPCSFWTINGWMYDFTTLVEQRQSNGSPVPLVFSMSYAWAEADQCDVTGNGKSCGQVGGSDTSYVDQTSTNFQKLGASGITLLGASGDAGAAGKTDLDCNSNPRIQPNFPASSPYITTVGGTMLQNGGTALTGSLPPFCTERGVTCAGGGTEVVASVPQSLITSGGGFSDKFRRLSYQSVAVNAWLDSNALQPPSSDFNSQGRAYPDVAGLAHKYYIVENGEQYSVDGTSASTPVTAGIIALINGNRLANNKAPVGFINSALYDMSSSSFNDITVGNNTGTEIHGRNEYCFTYGYGATAGWDPCTGLGTPDYKQWNSYWSSN